MLTISLTSAEKASLLKLHKLIRDKRVCDRIKAVIHKSNGWSHREIAEALLIHEDTVAQHLIDYQNDKLKPENGGSLKKLNEQQMTDFVAHVESKLYQSVHPIIQYLADVYQVDYSESGVRHLLKQQGFSYKKAKGLPQKLDAVAQAVFIKHYDALKSQLTEEEVIIFLDAAHPNCETKLSYGWIKKGKMAEKYVKTTANRSRVNVIGGLNLSAIELTTVAMVERVNAETVLDYFVNLKAQYGEISTLHIILDQAGYHRSEYFRCQVKLLGGIELHYLPPYSPNLNPIERLWKFANEEVRNNQTFSHVSELKKALDDFFKIRLPTVAKSLTQRLTDNFQSFPIPDS